VNNVTITLSNEEMTKIKIINLDELYKFYIHDFLGETIYYFKMLFQVDIF